FTSIDLLNQPMKLTADVALNQLVGFDGKPTGQDGKVFGYAKSKGSNGNEITIGVKGTREFVAGGPVAAGDDLVSDANGKPIKAPDGAKNIFGSAINAAGSGQIVDVLLK
ncbi:MAG: DUF2190 family protein, partial [Cohaesibacter sp.]|nr:DUF2190 family protein [Cohaesibacter sp.]